MSHEDYTNDNVRFGHGLPNDDQAKTLKTRPDVVQGIYDPGNDALRDATTKENSTLNCVVMIPNSGFRSQSSGPTPRSTLVSHITYRSAYRPATPLHAVLHYTQATRRD
eukprot:IDg5084t1